MNIQKELTTFKARIDKEIDRYLTEQIEKVREKDSLTEELLLYAKKFMLSGGKRLRAAFLYYGYRGAGGNEEQKIIEASISIELIHAFLLVHDDIMDRDDFRHGEKTVHAHFRDRSKLLFPFSDNVHFGGSMAIITGDMLASLGSERLFTSDFSSDIIVRALIKLQNIVSWTIAGEANDVYMSFTRKTTESDILRMYENKTARYTVEGPLHLGSVLAGADEAYLKSLSAFSLPIGVAFQIQDDVLGICGKSKKLGKPMGSDIEEGKMTLLLYRALELANAVDAQFLHSVVGKPNLSKKDFERIKEIFIACGALRYCQDMAKKYIIEGQDALKKASFKDVVAKDFLVSAAHYMSNREV